MSPHQDKAGRLNFYSMSFDEINDWVSSAINWMPLSGPICLGNPRLLKNRRKALIQVPAEQSGTISEYAI